MRTPIFDFVKAYADSNTSRFHMPGHKGKGPLGCERLDITEIDGADVLSHAEGIIAESERCAAELFGTAGTFYSAEGSTLCIKAMLAMAAGISREGKRARVLAARNAHKAFIYACAMLDIDVEWIYPDQAEHLCSAQVSADMIESRLSSAEELPAAVYLTSPDYLGNIADVSKIAEVCHEYGLPLLVDNAHGAYLNFLSPSRHPIALGADICCDSAHKTLPVLTGGAYLHISKNADARYCEAARDMMAVFATTSPSYLILQSLDLCNRYLAEGYSEALEGAICEIAALKGKIKDRGFAVCDTEPLKIVIDASASGYGGEELAAHLRKCGIEPEMADGDLVVLMATPENIKTDTERLLSAFELIEPRAARKYAGMVALTAPERAMSIREAMFAPSEILPVEKAEGRICGAPAVSCPPAIPIVVSGERISREAIELFGAYGIKTVRVLL
ncbi:MAG: PLP-dependent transferase [Clostridia bacterium]|nr:PLP-dependent transferase [Clostridia bacterium]